MEKTATMNLRVNPAIKQQAEDVLKQLGIPMATAVDMYLRQISLTGGKVPMIVNVDTMIAQQLRTELLTGYQDMRTVMCRTLRAHSNALERVINEAVQRKDD